MKSFTEGIDIDFEPVQHVYTYDNSKLKGATGFIDNYTQVFDTDRIATTLAVKHKVTPEEIKAMWKSNGNQAAGFGTALHATIEHYYTYKKLAEKMGKDQLPNHPFLRKILTELDEVRVDGETYQEVLVSHTAQGICGLIDDLLIIDGKKKICRIRDYKITHSIEKNEGKLFTPFSYLGSNKLAKNYLQMATYAYMLQCHGWTVEGVDIFNWTGEWKVYSISGLKLKKTILLVGTKL